jgi:hypothetical protein
MLDRNWELTKNKDGLNEDGPALYAAAFREIEPVLAKGQEQFITVDDAQWTSVLEAEANRRLFGIERSAHDDTKARRHPGQTSGTVTPTGTGGRHRRAGEEQPGATFPRP